MLGEPEPFKYKCTVPYHESVGASVVEHLAMVKVEALMVDMMIRAKMLCQGAIEYETSVRKSGDLLLVSVLGRATVIEYGRKSQGAWI